MIKPWRYIRSTIPQSFRVFSVRTDRVVSPRTGREHDFFVIESRDWVNVIPLTKNHQVVMVKQYRHGSRTVTLEIPGGLTNPGDTPLQAAARELSEETGYEAEEWAELGAVNPNPAIFNNRCHTFLARNVKRVKNPDLDQGEDLEVVLLPLSEIPDRIRKGEIDHAIVITAFSFYFLREPGALRIP